MAGISTLAALPPSTRVNDPPAAFRPNGDIAATERTAMSVFIGWDLVGLCVLFGGYYIINLRDFGNVYASSIP